MGETSVIDHIESEPDEEALSAEVDEEAATGDEELAGEAEGQEEAAAAGEDGEETPTGDHVPVAVLAEQRQQTRAAREETQDLRDKIVRMETLFERFRIDRQGQAADAAGEMPEEIPDYEADPLGHLQATNEVLQKQVAGLMGHTQEQLAAEADRGVENELMGRYESETRSFMETQPEYSEAYRWLADVRSKDLETLGYDNPKQREHIIKLEEGQIAGRALQAGKNPAEVLFNYAKARGFKAAPPSGNGADESAAGAETDEDKLARIEAGQGASRSLGGPKGGRVPAVSLERLAGMDEDDPEFDVMWNKARDRGLLG